MASLSNGNYYASYGGNTITITVSGAPTTTVSVTSSGCTVCPAVTPAPTTAPTPAPTIPPPTPNPTTAPTAATANLQVNAKKSTTAGTYYMWWSVDNTNWTQFSTALSTTCSNVGTTPSYPVGTTFYIMMSNSSGPTVQGWATLYSGAGDCPSTTTSCTSNKVTTVTSGLLAGWFTGNTGAGTC